MKKLIEVLLSSLFLVFPLCANADIIAQVNLTENATSPSQVATFPVLGSLNVLLDYKVSLNGGSWLDAFCVEATWSPPGTSAYTLLSIDNTLANFGLSAQTYEAAAWVAQNYASLGKDKASAQIAIWEIIFDGTTSPNLSNGYFSTGASQYTTEASYILSQLQLSSLTDSSTWALAVSPQITTGGTVTRADWQNYLVRVPEPTTLLFLGSGLIGLWAFRRKFRR